MLGLVEFDELSQIGMSDLRAVFRCVPAEVASRAIRGASPGIRHRILARLGNPLSERILARMDSSESVSVEEVRKAQAAVLEKLRALSRLGAVAFDDPEDMVA